MLNKLTNNKFTHFKLHTQYSICEGAIKIEELKEFCKKNKIKSLGISDSSNLCGALEFSESLSKQGTQPIIGTQIIIKYDDDFGFITLIAKNNLGYRNIIELSSKSYLENESSVKPFCEYKDLIQNKEGIILMSGTIHGFFGKLFNKGKTHIIEKLYKELSNKFENNFYIEIQRHGDKNEKNFESFNLNLSSKFNIPIIASHETYYLDQSMHDAHEALICIGNKTYLNDINRIKFSKEHYLKSDQEMEKLFKDIPESLENNYNLPYRCNFRPLNSKPILPNISKDMNFSADEKLKNDSIIGLKSRLQQITI